MKSAGRGLEMVAIGLGQAGGNLAAEFFRRGYRALALNTAHTDLAALSPGGETPSLPSEQRVYIGIDGYDGAGSDLNYGRECIAEHRDRIREVVTSHVAGADAVVLTAGFGGGTGSALSTLVEALQDLSLPLIALTTLPHDYESGIAKVNAVRAVNAMVGAPVLGWILVDNSLLSQIHGDVSLDQYYDRINRVIIAPLDEFNGLNGREGLRPIRPMDGEDFRSVLLSGGILNYGVGELPRLTVDYLMQGVRESMQYSTIMPAGLSMEGVSYMGIVIEATEQVLKETPFSFFEQVNEQLKEETGGAAVYMGVYRATRDKGMPVVWRLIGSSQTLPEGIQDMIANARREGGTLRDKLQQELPALELGEIEEFDLFRTYARSAEGERKSRRRIPQKPTLTVETPPFVKAPATSAVLQETPPAAPEETAAETGEEAAAEQPEQSEASEDDSSAPQISISLSGGPPQETESGKDSLAPAGKTSEADRQTYEKLMEEYRQADSEDARKQVSERLQADARSDSSLIRYYAVRAMTKLEDPIFADALQTASEDQDATVRSLAKKALRKAENRAAGPS